MAKEIVLRFDLINKCQQKIRIEKDEGIVYLGQTKKG
jgi:hypothetical protein